MRKSITRGFAILVLSFICASACVQGAPAQTKVGNTIVVVGHASVLDGGRITPLIRGTEIVQGDTIETGADGYVYITTVDQGFVSVRPNSSLTFDRYQYDPVAPDQTVIKLVLHNGVVREISGKGAQAARDHYRMNTPVAALGVRGTDFSVFTDANVTRAVVRSGGIVMTPLGGGCAASGFGPCEGPAAAQLFADKRNALMQVDRSSARPVVIDAKLSQLVPDQANPALKNEDAAARGATVQRSDGPGVAPTQLMFPLTPETPPAQEPARQVAPVLVPLPPPVPDPVPVAVPVLVPVPEATQIFWGRFAPIASLPADTTLAALLTQGSEQVGTILPFAMTRTPQQDMVMPATGSYAFGLRASEAYVVDSTTGIASAAAITNALLSIDFGSRTFSTRLDLTASGSVHTISGQGGVSSDGQLFSDYVSPAGIRGALAGKNATQAGYVFTQSLDAKSTAVGATQWGR
jgi:FecR protein